MSSSPWAGMESLDVATIPLGPEVTMAATFLLLPPPTRLLSDPIATMVLAFCCHGIRGWGSTGMTRGWEVVGCWLNARLCQPPHGRGHRRMPKDGLQHPPFPHT